MLFAYIIGFSIFICNLKHTQINEKVQSTSNDKALKEEIKPLTKQVAKLEAKNEKSQAKLKEKEKQLKKDVPKQMHIEEQQDVITRLF